VFLKDFISLYVGTFSLVIGLAFVLDYEMWRTETRGGYSPLLELKFMIVKEYVYVYVQVYSTLL
jgi:hypothetical protein